MYKILEFVDDIDGGGTGKVVYDYLNAMDKNDIDIDVLIFKKEDNHKQFLEDSFFNIGCNLIYISSRKNGLIKNLKEFKEVISNKKYDLIHSHAGDWSFPYLLIAQKAGIPVRIAHSHSTANSSRGIKSLIIKVLRFLLPFVTTNRYACGIDAGKFLWNRKAFEVMPNAIDINNYKFNESARRSIRDTLDISESCCLILHIGRFCYQKNNEYLVHIAKILRDKGYEFKVLMVGVGEKFDYVKELIDQNCLNEFFILAGMRRDVPDILSASDIFLLPSRYEGLPIVAVEAQTNGLTSILSDRITPEAKILKNTYYLPIDDKSADKWANAILKNKYNPDRENAFLISREKGYDIYEQSDLLKKKYIKYIEEKR